MHGLLGPYQMLSLLALLGAFSGAFLSLWSKNLWSAPLLLFAAVSIFIAVCHCRRSIPAATLLCSALLTAAWASYHAENRWSALWPEPLWRVPVQAEVAIASIPHRDEKTGLWRFDADLLRYGCKDGSCSGAGRERIRLHWYAPDQHLRSGQVWRLELRLKRPRSLMNDGGFDYRRYAMTRKLIAIGGVSRNADAVLIGQQSALLGAYRSWRQDYGEHLSERWADLPMRGLLLALALGERRDIEPRYWRLMQHTGVVHLMAISGLHIGIAAAAGWLLLSRMLSPLSAGRALALIGSGLIAITYAALAGFTLPTQRALIMVLAILLAKLLSRRLSAWHGWRWALWVLLVLDPLVVLDTGFYLSFLAVAVLLCCSSGGRLNGVSSWLGPQLSICMALLPLTLMMNGEFNPISVPANLVLIPLFSVLIVPGVLIALLVLGFVERSESLLYAVVDRLVLFLDAVLSWCMKTLMWLDSIPWLPSFSVPVNGSVLTLLGLAALIWVLPLPRSRTLVSVILLLMAFNSVPEGPENNEVWITVLDVGQGTSILIQSRDEAWVYDLGRSGSPRFNSSEHNLLPLLRRRGIQRLDGLVISHADNDHYGAYTAFLSQIEVGELWLGELLEGLAPNRFRYCRPGLSHRSSAMALEVLHPAIDQWEGNNASCVLKLTLNGSIVWLLTGDIERAAERALLARGVSLKSHVVLAPHHGSRTSSSHDFIAATQASEVIVTAAYRHHFGHPHPAVSERWRRANAQVLNVAECGALEWRYREGRLRHKISWREQKRRWWHDGDCVLKRHAQID